MYTIMTKLAHLPDGFTLQVFFLQTTGDTICISISFHEQRMYTYIFLG